jgi:hypothetical protein
MVAIGTRAKTKLYLSMGTAFFGSLIICRLDAGSLSGTTLYLVP